MMRPRSSCRRSTVIAKRHEVRDHDAARRAAASASRSRFGSSNTATQDIVNVTTRAHCFRRTWDWSTIQPHHPGERFGGPWAISTNSLTSINVVQGEVGAAKSRLEAPQANLSISIGEHLKLPSRPSADVDMAFEMVNFTKTRFCSRRAPPCLAQAKHDARKSWLLGGKPDGEGGVYPPLRCSPLEVRGVAKMGNHQFERTTSSLPTGVGPRPTRKPGQAQQASEEDRTSAEALRGLER